MNNIKVSASILSADFANLESEIKKVESAGIDSLHIDVMDGHFVNNITVGPCVAESISRVTNLPQWAHLMIENPQKYIKPFCDSGVETLIFHIETVDSSKAEDLIKDIHSLNCKAGIALNPDTPEQLIFPYLSKLDMILVMSVYPGFSGQKFIPESLNKIKNIRQRYKGDIGVDGGVNADNSNSIIKAGANILAAASFIFKSKDIKKAIESLRG